MKGRCFLVATVVVCAVSVAYSQPTISATKAVDKAAAGSGETLRYTVTISNSGDMDATGVQFADTVDPNTTFVPGSLKTTPIARDDRPFTTTGNVELVVATPGVLTNDDDPDGGTVTLIGFDPASAAGGDVAMNGDGSFTYNPPPGFEGTDTFTYTIQDDESATDTATVTIEVENMVWFIDGSAAPPGDGRFTSPFSSTQNYATLAADEPGDVIFIYDATYDQGITLLDEQQLIGEGVGLDILPSLTGPNAIAAGNAPLLEDGADGIVLARDNAVEGLVVGSTGGTGIRGTSVGTVTVRSVSILGMGGGVDIEDGTLAVELDLLDATSTSDEGIRLSNVTGTFGVAAGMIDTTNVAAIDISSTIGVTLDVALAGVSSLNSGTEGIDLDNVSGSFAVTGPATISGSALRSIDIAQSDAAISFAAVTIDGRGDTGIFLGNLSGSGVTFRDVDIPNQGGVRGYGIRIEGSSADVTFASADISGTVQTVAETDATGDAIPDNDGDGDAIFLKSNTGSFTLNGGTITDIADHGIDARDVSGGIRLTNVTIRDIGLGSGNPVTIHPDCVYALNLGGASLFQDCTFEDFEHRTVSRGVEVLNVNTSFTELRIRGTAFRNTSGMIGGDDAVLVTGRGTVSGHLILEDDFVVGDPGHRSVHEGLSGHAVRVVVGEANGSGTMEVDVTDQHFRSAVDPGGLGGLEFTALGSARIDIEVRNSTLENLYNANAPGFGNIHIAPFGSSSATAVIDGNVMRGNQTAANEGRRSIMITTGDLAGEFVQELDVTISNNTIDDSEHEAIFLDVRGAALTTSGNPARVRIVGNNIGAVTPVAQSGREALEIRTRDTASASGFKAMHLLIDGNEVHNVGVLSIDETIDIDSEDTSEIQATVTGNTIRSANATIGRDEFEIETEDPGSIVCADFRNNVVSEGAGSGNGTFHFRHLDGTLNRNQSGNSGTEVVTGTVGTVAMCTQPPLLATAGEGSAGADVAALTEVELASVAEEALARWRRTGLSTRELTWLEIASFEIVDLPAGWVGASFLTRIKVDLDAAGQGWFVDRTLGDDAEFDRFEDGVLVAPGTSFASGRIDLLTVLMHELGHALGRHHGSAPHLMHGRLPAGTRRLVSVEEATPAAAPRDMHTAASKPSDAWQSIREVAAPEADFPPSALTTDEALAQSSARDAVPEPVDGEKCGISEAELDWIVSAALERWSADGLAADGLARLEAVSFAIGDHADFHTGSATPTAILIDRDADPYGWFVDSSPEDDAEFEATVSETELRAKDCGPAGARMDLLTVVMHELGHVLGLDDTRERYDLMKGVLPPGVRRLPRLDPAHTFGAASSTVRPEAFIGSPVVLGTLNPGQTVTITFDVEVDDPSAVSRVCNAGTVSGANFTDVETGEACTEITNQPPEALCRDVTVSAGASCQGIVTPDQVDNGSSDPDGDPITRSLSPAGPYDLGNTTVTLSVEDGRGGVDTCTATVTVVDDTPPSIDCPPNIVVSNDPGLCGAVVTYSPPAGSDNCPGATTAFSSGRGSGAFFPAGTTTETYTVTDAAGNTASCSFTVTVIDMDNPTLVCPAAMTLSVDASCQAQIPAVLSGVSAADNCTAAGDITLSQSPAAGTPVGPGVHAITVTATDGAGNSTACTTTLTALDTTPPTVGCPPGTRIVTIRGQAPVPDVLSGVSAADNCTAAVDIALSQSPAAGTPVGTGVHTITVTATDAAGNSTACTTTLTVVPPITVSPTLISFGARTLGTASGRSLSITNTGTSTLSLSSIRLTPGSSPAFSVPGLPEGGAQVAPNARFTVQVSFRPLSEGAHSGTIVITSSVSGVDEDDIRVTLRGIGVQPAVEIVFRRGDANSDGVVDIADVLETLLLLFGSTSSPRCFDAVDSNDDGRIDLSDGVFTAKRLFDEGEGLPAPADMCAADQTDDELPDCDYPLDLCVGL